MCLGKSIKRESRAKILFDPSHKKGVVRHRENRIWYEFNVCQVMFSSGNLTEKMRMGRLAQPSDVVLDLYAGIGYFALSFLVHAKVRLVYCCEMNPHSIESLRRNLALNKIGQERYRVLEGDNAETTAQLINQGMLCVPCVSRWKLFVDSGQGQLGPAALLGTRVESGR